MAGRTQNMVTFGLGLTGDIPSAQKAIKDVANVVEATPIRLRVESTGNMETQLGDMEGFFDEMEKGAVNLEKLSVDFVQFRDKITGLDFKVPIKAYKEVRGETGEVLKSTREFNKALIETYEASKNIEKVEVVQALYNVGGATRSAEKEFNAMVKSFEKIDTAAGRFIEKSKNMSSRSVTDARNIAIAIREQKAQFDAAYSSGQTQKAQQHADEIRRLSTEFNRLRGAVDQGANAVQAWGTRIGNAIKQTISYSFSLGLVYKARQLLNNAIKYAIDLNTEMVKIQVLQAEGAKTPEEINALAQSFNNLGKEMGASTLEIARGSVEWFRQGRTIKETEELMKSALMLGKLGAMSAADATNYLTSITNAFKIETEDTVSVVDKLIAVDNIAATSAGELATAMRYTSESAAIAGVSMEQLISYIATVSTVTRQNAEMIGQAFKTMFARMTLIEGGGKDEEGWTISKVEEALKSVNIEVKNSEGNFRNMGDVLEDIAAKWDYLAERERMEIAIAIGGVRQKEPFLVLMDNMNLALKYQAEETNATGLAWERYGIYLESVEAKQGKLKAQTEDLMTSFVSSDFVGKFYDLANGALEFVNAIGGIPTILGAIAPLLTVIVGQSIVTGFLSLAGAISKAALALLSMEIAIAPLTIALVAIGAVISGVSLAIGLHNKKLEEQKQATEDAKNAVYEYIDALNKMPATAKNISDIIKEIEEIRSKPIISDEDNERLNELYRTLKDIAPNLDWKFKEGNPFLQMLPSAKEITEELMKQKTEALLAGQSMDTYLEAQQKMYNEYDSASEAARIFEQAITEVNQGFANTETDMYAARNAMTKWHAELSLLSESDEFETLPENLKEMIKQAIAYFDVESTEIAGRENFLANILKELGNEATKNDELKDGIARDVAEVVDGALSSSEAESWKPSFTMFGFDVGTWVVDGFAKAVGEKIFEEPPIPKPKGGMGGAWGGGLYEKMEAATISRIEKQNEAYIAQGEIIDNLGPKFSNLATIFENGEEKSGDYEDAVVEFAQEITSLGEEITGLPIVDIEKFMNAFESGDVNVLEDYKEELDKIINNTEYMATVSDDTKSKLINAWNTLSAATEEASYTVDVFGDTYTLNSQQAEQATNALAQALWKEAGESQGALDFITDTGETITLTSADQIVQAIEMKFISFTNLIDAATTYAGNKASYLGSYISNLMKALEKDFTSLPTYTGGGGGGGGGGGKDPNQKKVDDLNDEIKDKREEIKDLREEISDARDDLKEALEPINEAYEDAIDLIEKQIDDLEILKDNFGDYIDDQKESLRTAKETADFYESIKEKEEDLATLKTRLALLSGDDSEEAQAKRIELAEQIADLEEDIEKETDDRIYDVKIDALDKEKDAYDDMIDAKISALEELRQKEEDAHQNLLDDMQDEFDKFEEIKNNEIDKLEDEIEVIEKQRDALQDLIGDSGGGGGGGGGSYTTLGTQSQLVLQRIKTDFGDIIDKMGVSDSALEYIIESFLELDDDIEAAYQHAKEFLELLEKIGTTNIIGTTTPIKQAPGEHPLGHSGGAVPQDLKYHSGGAFAGGLNTNEVFAKLLKGEYIATETQMRNFLTNIMPKIAMQMGPTLRHRTGEAVQKAGDVNIDVDIIVEGSLDKTVVPELKKEMVKELIKALELRGIRRNATVFGI